MVSTNKLVELIEENLGKQARVKYIDAISCDMLATLPDLSLIQKNLGYQPKVPIEIGIKRFIEWYKNYAHEGNS